MVQCTDIVPKARTADGVYINAGTILYHKKTGRRFVMNYNTHKIVTVLCDESYIQGIVCRDTNAIVGLTQSFVHDWIKYIDPIINNLQDQAVLLLDAAETLMETASNDPKHWPVSVERALDAYQGEIVL